MNKIKVYLVECATMAGKEFLDTAYSNEDTCKLICSELASDWATHTPIPAEGELISGEIALLSDRVIIGTTVYPVDYTSAKQLAKKHAMSKLTDFELIALGLKEP